MTLRFHCIFLLLAISLNVVSQTNKPINSPKDKGFTTFSIKGTLDTVNFVVSDTSLTIKKPLFIFCQGSLPYALFYKEDSLHTYQQAIPFNYKKHLKEYYFVVISKPAIPVFTTTADKDYFYIVPVTKKTPEKYYRSNYLDYYVTTANDVINYLIKQKWLTNQRLLLRDTLKEVR